MVGVPTYEEVVDDVVRALQRRGALGGSTPAPTPWDAFLRLSEVVHDHYTIPSTTVTPIMRRLLFALGVALRPATAVGVGTFVGYAFTWLLGNRHDTTVGPFIQEAVGVDVDAAATRLARRNCAVLGHHKRLTYLTMDGVAYLRGRRESIDLLWIDLDDPLTGKAQYVPVLRQALPLLRPGSIVLAHDPCVPRFAEDFTAYDRYVQSCRELGGACVLPVDSCGLAMAWVPAECA